MARELRIHEEGLIVHWMFRGNGGQNIFDNQAFARRFLYFLAKYAPKFDVSVWGFCLMGNHGHMLTRSGKYPLGDLTEILLGRYARYVNFMRGTRGHLLEDRYLPIVVKNDAQLLCTLRYIHRNPVEAGFCSTPEEWPFSSHHAFLGSPDGITTTEPLLGFLSPKDPLGAYRRFMDSPAPARLSYEDKLWREAPSAALMRPSDPPARTPKQLEELAELVGKEFKLNPSILKGHARSTEVRVARRRLIELALDSGFNQAQVARLLGRSRAAITQLLGRIER